VLLPSAAVRRRPRRANDGTALPGDDDFRAERRRAQPQCPRTYRARAPRGRRRRTAALGVAAGGVAVAPHWVVIAGLDPAIHHLCQRVFCEEGWTPGQARG